MTSKAPCVARHINHICLAVRDIEATIAFYQKVFGAGNAEVEEISDQGVLASLLRVGGSQLEFIQPTDPDGDVARFIERNGEGMHHICFEVDDIQATLDRLDAEGIELIDKSPREGLSGTIAFLHPRATGGVLVELVDQATARR